MRESTRNRLAPFGLLDRSARLGTAMAASSPMLAVSSRATEPDRVRPWSRHERVTQERLFGPIVVLLEIGPRMKTVQINHFGRPCLSMMTRIGDHLIFYRVFANGDEVLDMMGGCKAPAEATICNELIGEVGAVRPTIEYQLTDQPVTHQLAFHSPPPRERYSNREFEWRVPGSNLMIEALALGR